MDEPAVPPQGTLERHPLSAVLRSLQRAGRDGCLTVSRGAITRKLYVRGGMLVYATSNEPSDRLGEILVAQGTLTKADHKRYWEESQAGNRQLGITLVLNGRITLHELYQAVTAQVVTILDRVQKWRKGDYSFAEGEQPRPGTALLRIPLALYLKADADKRATPRKSRAKKGAAPPPPPPEPEPEEESIEIGEEAPAAAPAAAAPAEDPRIGEVSFMVQELRRRLGQDPRSLLGVATDADREGVQAAYHRIAKILHADRLPPGCPPELAREAGEIFLEVTAASQAIADEKQSSQRPAPAAATRGGKPAQPPTDEELARHFFAKGREWVSKRNYWQAADAFRQAVRLEPESPIYRQYLGLSLIQMKRTHEAEEHLAEAARLEPANAAHWVNLGRVYRAGRLVKKAREAFERALRLEPRNAQAREELADLPEDPSPAKKSDGGLLKKLFGK